jgi:hypothetical protein
MKRFLVSMPKRDKLLLQITMVPWVDGTILKRNITESITRNQTSLSGEWMRKFTVSSLTHFHHLMFRSIANHHSFQTVLIHLLMRVLPSQRENTIRNIMESTIRNQTSLSGEWMRKFTVSSLTPFHHSTLGSVAQLHSFQTVLTHLLTMVLLSLREDIIRDIIRIQMSLREEWTRRFMVS